MNPPPIPSVSASPATPPDEAVARSRFACSQCGGEATWNPERKVLACSHCGTVAPVDLSVVPDSNVTIQEHDLVAALESIPSERRGWRQAKIQVRCQSCTAISVFDPDKIGKSCEFCGSSALVPYEQVQEAFSPESLLPMVLGAAQVRDAVRAWYASRWFAPSQLGTRAMTDTVRGVYIPYWTFDARVQARWTAMSGYHYYVTESYTDAQGNQQTRQVQQTRWVPSSGSVRHFFDDELVSATQGVDATLLRGIEPFPTEKLVPYEPGFLAGWTVERYQIDLVAAAKRARESMSAQLRSMCAAQVPGDTHMNLSVYPDWSGQTFKHILVPVWVLTYHYHGRPYQLVVNAVTGAIAGSRPYSVWKILSLVVVVLLVFGMIVVAAKWHQR